MTPDCQDFYNSLLAALPNDYSPGIVGLAGDQPQIRCELC